MSDFTCLANQLCYQVANYLAPKLNKASLLILMPTLERVPDTDYLVSSYNDPLALNDLVLSDDNERLIIISECLSASRNDTHLRHATHFNGHERQLSETEHQRVYLRCNSTRNISDLIMQLFAEKTFGDSVGSNIKRLADALRQGDLFHDGFEYDSGAQANEGILNFFLYWESIPLEIKEKVGKIQYFLRNNARAFSISFAQLWNRLINPHNIKNNGWYCVNIIAGQLDDLLNANPDLFTIYVEAVLNQTSIKKLEVKINNHFKTLKPNLKRVKNDIFYRNAGDEWLLKYFLNNDRLHIITSQHTYVPPIEFLQNMLCLSLNYHNGHKHNLALIINNYLSTAIQTVTQLAAMVASLLQEQQDYCLNLLGKNKIKQIITTRQARNQVVAVIGDQSVQSHLEQMVNLTSSIPYKKRKDISAFDVDPDPKHQKIEENLKANSSIV